MIYIKEYVGILEILFLNSSPTFIKKNKYIKNY